MAITEIQKQTNANIQEKANLIWEIATHLVGLYKPHEYGNAFNDRTDDLVIVIRYFHCYLREVN